MSRVEERWQVLVYKYWQALYVTIKQVLGTFVPGLSRYMPKEKRQNYGQEKGQNCVNFSSKFYPNQNRTKI